MTQNKHHEAGELIVIISIIVVVLALIGIGITIYETNHNQPKAAPAKQASTQHKSNSNNSTNQSTGNSQYQPVNSTTTNGAPATTNVAPGTPAPTGGSVAGKFVQPENISWPNDQQMAYVVVAVDPSQMVNKVMYYEAGKLVDTETTPAATGEYQYSWNIANVAKGKYQFTALVFDGKNKSAIATNNQGNPFVDMYVKSH